MRPSKYIYFVLGVVLFILLFIPIYVVFNPGKYEMEDIGAWEVIRIIDSVEIFLIYALYCGSVFLFQLQASKWYAQIFKIISLLTGAFFGITAFYMFKIPMPDLQPLDGALLLFLLLPVAIITIVLDAAKQRSRS